MISSDSFTSLDSNYEKNLKKNFVVKKTTCDEIHT